MKIVANAIVQYTCTLTETDAQKVRDHAEKMGWDLEYSAFLLYNLGEIDLYKNSVESDFDTQEVVEVDDD
jgi:hypothetical protein